jgi:hypothetical protein
MLVDFLKKKQLCASKIQRQFRIYKLRKVVFKNLKNILKKGKSLKLMIKTYESF